PPTLVGTAVVDQHAAVLGALGVLAALYERRDTGLGKKVDSNLLNARSGDILWDGEMLVMGTPKHPAHPLGKLVRSEKPVGLHD
ncbi:CoA transferase, partial [Staphylococcus aureus]|uniref:CoA transferase n=1 Tax=Staphylococcus aureus TaxID=1280 RepID=UPI0010E3F38B